jgi:hypothetical protein
LLNFSFNYHRILFENLPSDVIIRIVKAFRKMQKKNDSGKDIESKDRVETPNWDQMVFIPFNQIMTCILTNVS